MVISLGQGNGPSGKESFWCHLFGMDVRHELSVGARGKKKKKRLEDISTFSVAGHAADFGGCVVCCSNRDLDASTRAYTTISHRREN